MCDKRFCMKTESNDLNRGKYGFRNRTIVSKREIIWNSVRNTANCRENIIACQCPSSKSTLTRCHQALLTNPVPKVCRQARERC